MIRVLLIIEDYNESSFLQITLKKLGVDVETNLNPYTLSNTILSFQPQMVLLTAKGKKINGLKVAIDIKKSKTNSKLVFVKKTGQDFVDKLLQDGAIDGMLVSPISPANVIELLARSFDLDETELKEKFLKSQSSKSLASDENEGSAKKRSTYSADNEVNVVKGGDGETKNYSKFVTNHLIEDLDRRSKYDQIVEKIDLPDQQGLEKKKIREFNAELRAQQDPEELKKSQINKRAFVDAMFSTKKK